MIWNLVDSGAMDGFKNMAYDLGLLSNVKDIPILRFYEWNPPALSIGRFQNTKDINFSYLKDHNFDLVRRPSGGRAVLHHDELTYSIVLPASMSSKSVTEVYLFISQAIVEGLKSAGLKCEISQDKKENYSRFSACFAVSSIYEIVLDGKKLVGSAQVRRDGKILQHGSIPVISHVEEYANCFSLDEIEREKLLIKLNSSMTSVGEYLNLTIGELKEFIKSGFQKILNVDFRPLQISFDVDEYVQEAKVWA
jgi:lipoate-protein ligase A